MTDPIADMLTRIRNAQLAKKTEVFLPFSKIKFSLAEILKKEGYIESVEKVDNHWPEIKIELKYKDNKPIIRQLKRISKVGQRIYVTKENIPQVLNGLGFAIISTSKGLLTNKEAKKQGIGGEVICEIY